MSKQQNPFSEFFSSSDFSKLTEQMQMMPFDVKAMMEAQRKNIQAITDAQHIAMESMQALAQRQSEIISQIVEDQSTIAKENLSEKSPEQKIANNADMFKKMYEKTVSNMRQLSDMINKSHVEASNVINKRISASLNEIKSAAETQKKKAA